MKTWKLFTFATALGLMAIMVAACRTPQTAGRGGTKPPAELVQPPYLYEVTRHLYRWYLDEAEVDRVTQAKQFVFWVRPLHPRLDAGDQSELAEIVLPQLGLSVKVKKADYRIEELQTTIKSGTFKITQVTASDRPRFSPGRLHGGDRGYAGND